MHDKEYQEKIKYQSTLSCIAFDGLNASGKTIHKPNKIVKGSVHKAFVKQIIGNTKLTEPIEP
jgi:hypothetical protein